MPGLVYDVPPFTAHQWRYHKLIDPAAQASESAGRQRYEAFPTFASEVFHRLHDDEPARLETPAPGAEPFQVLHDALGVLPEVEALREQARNDEHMAGIATAAILDTLLAEAPAPDAPVGDPASDEEVLDYLRRLREQQPDDAGREAIDRLLEEAEGERQGKLAAARAAAATMDETQIRNALRAGAAAARAAMDEAQRALDGFGAGLGAHSGRQERHAASRKLSGLLRDNPHLRRVAELAGRLRRLAAERQAAKPRRGADEVTGVERGADLARLLPSEMMFMEEPFDPVFVARLSERSLAQFELHQKPPQHKGPVVFLLDSSGSMSGDPIAWAGALALAFLDIAVRQRRAFALVHFGGSVLRVDRFAAGCAPTVDAMIDAVGFFAADGGTNFEKPLARALQEVEERPELRDADVVMVTDGKASVSDAFLARWNEARKTRGLRCFSVLVGAACDRRSNARFSDEVIELADAIRQDAKVVSLFGEV